MIEDGTYVATVDRITEGLAVILVEEDDELVEEFHRLASRLPETVHEGTVVRITIADGELESVEPDPEGTACRRASLERKFDRLAKRPPDRDDTGEER